MSSQPYSFCFLRYIHDALSGEFANVGVAVWAPESHYLGFLGTSRYSRLSHFFAQFDPDDYRNLIGRIKTRFDALAVEFAEAPPLYKEHQPASARDIALKVVPHDSSALQWSLSGGGLCQSPKAEMEKLFEKHIQSHYNEMLSSRRDEATVYKSVYKKAFIQPEVKKHIKPHEIIAPLAKHTFEQSWQNGLWNVYQTLSFDLKKPEDIRQKAYRWHSQAKFLAQSRDKHKLHLLLGAPKGKNEKAYGDAKDILHASSDIVLIEEDEANDFASNLRANVLAASESEK